MRSHQSKRKATDHSAAATGPSSTSMSEAHALASSSNPAATGLSPTDAGHQHSFRDMAVDASSAGEQRAANGKQPEGSSGNLLPEAVRGSMERPFGHTFSNVRVHADSEAAELSQSLDARAFAQGEDVYFGAGQFAPHTVEGSSLLAHELAHVVQHRKRGAPSVGSPAMASDSPSDGATVSPVESAFERQADEASALATQGQPVPPSLLSPAGSASKQRKPTAAPAKAAAPPRPRTYRPPIETGSGALPQDSQVVTLNMNDVQFALQDRVHWRYNALELPGVLPFVTLLSRPSFWTAGRNLTDAMTPFGFPAEHPKIDLGAGKGFLTIKLRIRAQVRNLLFEGTDATGFSDASAGGSSLSQATSTAEQSGAGVSAALGNSQEKGGLEGTLGASASTQTTTTQQGGVATSATNTVGTNPGVSSVRFRGDIDWGFEVTQLWEPSTVGAITSLGGAYLGDYLGQKANPTEKQIIRATSHGVLMKFHEPRCEPIF